MRIMNKEYCIICKKSTYQTEEYFKKTEEYFKKHNLTLLHLSLKLFQKPQIILIKQPDILYIVFHHCHSLNANPESKTPVFIAVYATIFKYGRVNHSASENFY